MKWFRTLQFRLSALVFSVGFALIGITGTRQYRRDVASQREQMRLSAFTEGTRLSGLAQHLLRRLLPQAADLAIGYASVQPDLRLGVICDGSDVIRHGSDKQWRHVKLQDSPLASHLSLVKEARKNMEGRIEETEANRRLVAIFPFWDVAGGMSKGVVILDYDLERPVLLARAHALRESAAEACALLGGCMLLWALLHLLVTERVGKIVTQTNRIGWNSEIPRPIDGKDELALISSGIADAVRRLQNTERKLSQIAANMRDLFWIAPAHPSDPVYVNAAYEPLLGRRESQLKRRRWDWLGTVVREDRRKALELLQRLRKSAGEMEIELRLEVGGGMVRWVQCRGFSMQRNGESAPPLQVMGVVMDITERKEVERRLLEATEQERRRIGQDLHDDVCQRLAAAQLKSGVLQASLTRKSMTQAQLAGEVAQELAETADIARGYARGLAPVAFGVEALPDALEDLGIFLQKAFGVPCYISCENLDGLMPPEKAAQVYRIVQELATNAAKHSHASWIEVSLARTDRILRIEVSHDGARFDPAAEPRRTGMGLHLVQQRVDALGAFLTFQARHAADGGTIAICEIPLRREVATAKRSDS